MSYNISHIVSFWLTSMWSTRPRGWRPVVVILPLAGFMAALLSITLPAELVAISEGDIGGAWEFWTFLLISAVILGLGAGVVETTGAQAVAQTMPGSPLAAFVRMSLSCLVRLLTSSLQKILSIIAIVSVVNLSRRRDSPNSSSPLTPDLWPSGASPRLIYEPA